jgi:hypothetical protein
MIPKAVATPLALAGLLAVLFALFRPSCPSEPKRESLRRSDGDVTQKRAERVEALRVVSGVHHRSMESRRNVFAYAQQSQPRRLLLPPVETINRPAEAQIAVVRSEPDFPYKYIGRFGPDANPLAVFILNRDVVNARVGDPIGGEFRLSSIGIESVEVLLANGSIRRVSIQP